MNRDFAVLAVKYFFSLHCRTETKTYLQTLIKILINKIKSAPDSILLVCLFIYLMFTGGGIRHGSKIGWGKKNHFNPTADKWLWMAKKEMGLSSFTANRSCCV